MDGVIKNDATREREPKYASRGSDPRQATDHKAEQGNAPDPNRFQANRSRWNRAFFAVLPVKLHIERIIEKHSPGVQRSGAHEQIRQFIDVACASKPPAGEAIRPDRRQVRHAAKHKQGPQKPELVFQFLGKQSVRTLSRPGQVVTTV